MNKDCSSSMISTIFLLLLSFTCSVISQSDSCSTLLSVSNLIPFNTSSLTCVAAWNSEGFILRYAKAGPRLWSFVLSAPDSGTYVAIGFTPNGRMVGSSAVVGWVPGGGGAVVAKQYSLGGYSSSQCPPDQGDLPLVQRSSVLVSKHSRVYLAFQLGTVQPQQNLIYAVGPAGTLPSAGGYLSAHRNMASDTLAAPAAGGGGGGVRIVVRAPAREVRMGAKKHRLEGALEAAAVEAVPEVTIQSLWDQTSVSLPRGSMDCS
ncbi:cytochrome b561 and DOMON domain-containing protein At3g07570-like isoform X2 [Zingiber officinale]|uniref:cytochrome b561 and DOMON domain-containing protein At3g07570-like isoform X2 n=1 Tax=Zingiber officinale TaxID=94328 RepID=UPI001C4C40D8|nr:cytochrome b561 and DOMON domain-containing protein At3g07570-like isoform X2 [Zingiber officinale]